MIILKHNPKKYFSPLFFIEEDHRLPVGFLETDGIELMKVRKTLVPIEQVEIIEKYFTSVDLIKDVNKCEYYQLNTQTK